MPITIGKYESAASVIVGAPAGELIKEPPLIRASRRPLDRVGEKAKKEHFQRKHPSIFFSSGFFVDGAKNSRNAKSPEIAAPLLEKIG